MWRAALRCTLLLFVVTALVAYGTNGSGGHSAQAGPISRARTAALLPGSSGADAAVQPGDTPDTFTPGPTATDTPVATNTSVATAIPTASDTPTATETVPIPSDTPTETGTPIPTDTGTATPTWTPSPTSTPTGLATISVNPNSASPSGFVSVTGSGFTANATISIQVAGETVALAAGGTTVSDTFGNFTTTIVVPADVLSGVAVVSAFDGLRSASTYLSISSVTATPTVSPTPGASLVLAPVAGPPGTTVSLSLPAGGLPVGYPATVTFQDANASNPVTTLGTGTVNADGSFTLSIALPAQASSGNGTLSVSAGGRVQSAIFSVQPAIYAGSSSVSLGSTILVSGNGFASNSTLTFQIGGLQAVTAAGTAVVSNALGSFSATLVLPAAVAAGTVTVSATDLSSHTATTSLIVLLAGAPTLTASTPTLLPTAPPISTVIPSATPIGAAVPVRVIPRDTTTSYFAEGYTGQATSNGKANFTETLDLLNPDPAPASVTITYYIQGSATALVLQRTLAASSVLRERVNTDVGANKLVAATVSAPKRVTVTRTILRTGPNATVLDGSTSQGIRKLGTSWSFAEGYTGSTFQEYLTILNPGHTVATVTIRLAPQAASAVGARSSTVTVPALSRATVDIRALNAGAAAQSVGMIVSSDQAIVAERVEYFGVGSGSGKFGASVTAGVVTPATQTHLTYGTSGGSSKGSGTTLQPTGDQDYISLLNPSLKGNPVTVAVTFTGNTGKRLGQQTVRVAPGTRQTVIANDILGAAAGPFSVALSASGPIAAEAMQYFAGSPNTGIHPVVAVPALTSVGTDLLFSSLGTVLADGTSVQRAVYLYNPGSTAVQVTATYFTSTGKTVHAGYTVLAGSITTVQLSQAAAALPAGALGAEYTVSGGSGILAYAVGKPAGNRTAVEDVGSSPS